MNKLATGFTIMLWSKQPKNIQQLRELRNALPSDVSNGKVWINFLNTPFAL